MTKSIITALAATMLFAVPLSAAPASDGAFQVAQTQVPKACAQIANPTDRAACVKRMQGK